MTPAHVDWDPERYARFADERSRPGLELLARVPLEQARVVCDLGCGDGTLTRALSARWPEARVTGIDSSPAMIDAAALNSSTVCWVHADIAEWTPDERPDVIYSNAALHWLPDHDALFPRLLDRLAAGGCLAVQMPLSWSAPSHALMRSVLESEGLGDAALRARMSRRPVADAPHYYDVLSGAAQHVDVWETEYLHVLRGADAVFEWVRTTGLRPILEALAGDERERFLDRYRTRLRDAYPPRGDGMTLYPFRRLFVVAVRRRAGTARSERNR